jgi:NADH-quinone oxidoreductase subunit K
MDLLNNNNFFNIVFYRNTTVFISNFFMILIKESDLEKLKIALKLFEQHPETITLLPTWFITSFIFFSFAALFFSAGLIGLFFNNKNFLLILLKAEIMFLGLNLWFIGFSIYSLNYVGYVYALLLFGLVAAESAIGLSLFLVFFFLKKQYQLIFLYIHQRKFVVWIFKLNNSVIENLSKKEDIEIYFNIKKFNV